MNEVLERDQNHITVLGGITDDANQYIRMLRVDPTTKRLLVSGIGSGGGLTPANGQYKIFVTVGSDDADYLISNYTDIGAAINAAYAGLPSAGGTIYVKDGSYSYSTPILFSTAQKFVKLMSSPAGNVTLTYTGTGSTVALTYNISKAISTGAGIQGIKFVGPSSSGNTIGVMLGGNGADDSKGAAGVTLRDVQIRGFGVGLQTGNNVFIITVDNCVINFCKKLAFFNGGAGPAGGTTINSGENMKFVNCTFADSNNTSGTSTCDFAVHVQISGITDFNFIGTSFDDAQLYIDQFTGSVSTNNIHCTDCHFENPAANAVSAYYFIDSLANQVGDQLYLTNCQFAQQASTSAPAAMIRTGSNVTLTGVTFMKNFFSGASTVTRAVLLRDGTSVNTLNWFGCNNIQTAVTYMTNTLAFTPTGMANGGTGYMTLSNAGKMVLTDANTIIDPTTYPGADIGAQINAAYAASTDRCVHMRLPAGVLSFSTNIVFDTNNKRIKLEGDPGEGTELLFTGTGIAITVNTGIQSSSPFISHSSGYGLFNFRIVGNNNTDRTTQKGIYCGGSNGAAHMVIESVDIFGFGTGLETGANTYHWLYSNGTIRDNFRNVHINSASNSGEMMHFFNAFIVDVANNNPADGFYVADYGCASLVFTGGSIDDCQVHFGLQISAVFNGVHFENPGPAWGKYTYVVVDDSSFSNVTFNGGVFYNNATTNRPDQFITSNGANINLIGIQFFKNGGNTVPLAINGGRANWYGLVNANTCITNIIGAFPFTRNGSNQTTLFDTIGVVTSIVDINTNELLKVTATASAVNELTLANAATAGYPTFTASGGDTNIGIQFITKGTGDFRVSNPGSTNNITFNNTDGTSFKNQFSLRSNGTEKWSLGNDFTNAGLQNFYIYDAVAGGSARVFIETDKITLGGGTAELQLYAAGNDSAWVSFYSGGTSSAGGTRRGHIQYENTPATLTIESAATNGTRIVGNKFIVNAPTNYGVDAGASDSYAITMTGSTLPNGAGCMVVFKANTANTGAASLNINGGGAITIIKGVSTTLANNDILANMLCWCVFDGSSWVLLNPRAL